MQDKSIDGALLALRKQIIRGDLDGLAHVEALLTLRGVHMPAVLPAKRKDVAGKGHMAIWIMQALADGPLPFRGVVDRVATHRPELDYKAACSRTGQALNKLMHKGRIVRVRGLDGWMWKLAGQR